MSLNIKSAEADRLVTEVSNLTGASKTQAVIESLRQRLERETLRRGRQGMAADVLAIREKCAIVVDRQGGVAAGRQFDALISRTGICNIATPSPGSDYHSRAMAMSLSA
ncbi:MAG: type II toxin-antitoxin system VapB family antitoxin [Pseudomonadota bacterium]